MVRELHEMGFERMRAQAFMHSNMHSTCWSCTIVPSICVDREHSGTCDGDMFNLLMASMGWPCGEPNATAGTHHPFGWEDARLDTPYELAQRFLARFRDLTYTCWGPDPMYVQWYEKMLEATAPYGVFYPLTSEPSYVVSAYTPEDVRIPAAPFPM
jgi:hypothetical protein